MTTFSFTVPGKPMPWQRAGIDPRDGHHYTPQKTVEYQRKVRLCAMLAGVKVLERPVRLELRIYLPDDKTRDDDNIEKSIRDALQGSPYKLPVAYLNDSHIRRKLVIVELDKKNPRVEVKLSGKLAKAPQMQIRGLSLKPAVTRPERRKAP